MSYDGIIHVAVGVVINRQQEILISQRHIDSHQGSLWEFPGGKVEPMETPEIALIRELKEEIGIDTWSSCLAPLTFASHSYEDFHLLMPVFLEIPLRMAYQEWTGPLGISQI